MAETPEEQRKRLERKRIAEAEEPLIQCLECSLYFRRVGSHVVQVHGYANSGEYRREHGLMQKETRTERYAKMMAKKASTITNLEKGAAKRFGKEGGNPHIVSEFWKGREEKLGTRSRKLQVKLGYGERKEDV